MIREERERRGWGYIRKPRYEGARFAASYMHIHEGKLKRWSSPFTFSSREAAGDWLNNERRLIDRDTWTPPAEREHTPFLVREFAKPTPQGGQREGQKREQTALLLREYAEPALRGRRLEPTTRVTYKRLWETRIEPALGDRVLRDITADDLEEWWRSLGDDYESSRGSAWNLLKSILKQAADDEIIAHNPAAAPKFIHYGDRVTRRPLIILSPAELLDVAAQLPSYYAIAVEIMAWCSLRFAEMSELRVKDIRDDELGMLIRIGSSAPMVDGVPVAKKYSKSDPRARDIWVPPNVAARIRSHLKTISQKPDTFIVTNFRGDRLPRATFTKAFKAALPADKAAMNADALRHTGGVLAAKVGATVPELQERLGYSTSSAP
ncbi:tyrosine-type recombinase/integrase [Gordonia pseudamarae]|uniref:tyrosine-type recombinase/integrase n=1 Tax=Gordonia pseudamarae TaxID=2831662 RepID=UPI001BCA846B|nr:site-specific integrase [Gordonia pseudamarae]